MARRRFRSDAERRAAFRRMKGGRTKYWIQTIHDGGPKRLGKYPIGTPDQATDSVNRLQSSFAKGSLTKAQVRGRVAFLYRVAAKDKPTVRAAIRKAAATGPASIRLEPP